MSELTVDNPNFHPRPWMQQQLVAIADRLANHTQEATIMLGPNGERLMMTPLGGKQTEPGSEEDKTCDKCDRVFPDGLWTFGMELPDLDGFVVTVTGGLCTRCAAEEGVHEEPA